MENGEIYTIKPQYSVSIGCNIIQGGRIVEVCDSNKKELEAQSWKLEKQVIELENKMMKRPVGRPPTKREK